MTTTTTTATTSSLLRVQVAAKVATITAIMAAYRRNPDQWTCTGDCEESQWCDDGDDRCDAGDCAHMGECCGPDGCDTASDLQSTYGGDNPGDALRGLPLSVTCGQGRPFSALLTAGGPRVEIVPHPTRPGLFRVVGKSLGTDPVVMTADAVTAYAEWWADMG